MPVGGYVEESTVLRTGSDALVEDDSCTRPEPEDTVGGAGIFEISGVVCATTGLTRLLGRDVCRFSGMVGMIWSDRNSSSESVLV